MVVVREDDRLPRAAELGEKAERAGGSGLVEARQEIVADEGQRLRRAQLQQGEAQRQKQLVARALAHAGDRHARAVFAKADQHRRVVIVVIGAERLEGAVGGDGEKRGGSFQQRVLHRGAMTLDRLRGEPRRARPRQPAVRDIDQRRARLGLVLRGAGGVAARREGFPRAACFVQIGLRGRDVVDDLLSRDVEPLDLAGQQVEIEIGLLAAQRVLVEAVAALGEVAGDDGEVVGEA